MPKLSVVSGVHFWVLLHTAYVISEFSEHSRHLGERSNDAEATIRRC